MVHVVEMDVAGRRLRLETGRVAKQADGAVLATYADTVVLATAVASQTVKPGIDFLPLTVNYQEKAYAAGKIPGGYFKREGRLSEKEVLTSRMIDRPMRPLFPEGYTHETQIIAMVLSADPEQDPAVLAIIGAAAALAISDIPFHHVVGAVRVGLVDGKMLANPTYTEERTSKLNIMVTGTKQGIVMVEAGAQQVSEAQVLDAIEFGHDCCKTIASAIDELVKVAGKKKREFTSPAVDQPL